MSMENSTISDFHVIEVNAPALSIIQDFTINAGGTMVEISLVSLFFGILTVLSFTSTYFLTRRGSLAHTNVRVLVLSTILIYVSTGTYVAALIWNRIQENHLVEGAVDGLFFPEYDNSRHEWATFEDGVRKQSPMAVIALQANWIIGDAIVWWRACVVWRNKVVYCIGPLLVTVTLILGLIGFNQPRIIQTTGIALLEVYNPYMDAFGSLSLGTNILATSLIAYKAWEHRQLVKKYLSEVGTSESQVLKALALLVESGSVYCVLMIFILIDQTWARVVPSPAPGPGLTFTKVATYFVYGCLVPLVAIYPTMIVFLVALRQSPIENGGLSEVHRTHGRGVRHVEEGMESTVVFHHSQIYGTDGID